MLLLRFPLAFESTGRDPQERAGRERWIPGILHLAAPRDKELGHTREHGIIARMLSTVRNAVVSSDVGRGKTGKFKLWPGCMGENPKNFGSQCLTLGFDGIQSRQWR